MLDSNPSGNGDITSILKILPNVQYDNGQNKSATPGEIDPANISISGGLYYQNNFQLDGFNMNNDLNPIASSLDNFNSQAAKAMPGRSQGLNVDTSLLESIKVQDSNISASYGGFTGGVIEANTRKAKRDFGASISYQVSQGNANPSAFSLTQYHIPQDELNSFLNSSLATMQPHFIKHSIRSSIESKINDKLGVIASFTTMQSFIYLNAGDSDYLQTTLDSINKTQKRQSYNFFIKANYDYSKDLSFELSYSYMPQYNNYFLAGVKDSGFDMLSGGHMLGGKAMWQNALGVLNIQASLSLMDNSRTNSQSYYAQWRPSIEKYWTTNKLTNQTAQFVKEGGYGNVNSRQISSAIKVSQDFKPLQTSIIEHKLSVGGDIGYVSAYYNRLDDLWYGSYYNLSPLKAGQSCQVGDVLCSNSQVYYSSGNWADNIGQFAGYGTLYKKGKISLDNTYVAAFVENDMNIDAKTIGEFNVRIGARLDYDTYMDKHTIAPRFSLNYITPWSKDEFGKDFATQVTFGANRYYGRNLFAYRLLDGQSALEYSLSRNDPTAWNMQQMRNDTRFQQLKVPYSDELMAGITQKLYMFSINAKYITRKGRDEVRRMCADNNGNLAVNRQCTWLDTAGYTGQYIYTNSGRSDSDIISIVIENHKPIEIFNIQNFFALSYDRTNVYRNYTDFSTQITQAEIDNEIIYYEGEGFIRLANKPTSNFSKPFSFRLSTTHLFSIAKSKWTWNNFFRIRSAYDAMARIEKTSRVYADKLMSYNGALVDTYVKFRVPLSVTWDMKLGFEIDMYKGNTLMVSVDIYNLLDRKNMYILSTNTYSSYSGSPSYEVGRQFWLNIGYKI